MREKVRISEDSVKKLIARVLEVPLEKVTSELAIGDIPEWDSLSHMRIITALESDLGISLDIEQTIEIEDVDDIVDVVCG